VDHFNLPLNDYTRAYLEAVLAAGIIRAVLPRMRPREIDAIWSVMPERPVITDRDRDYYG
jgi:hypothetical protein